MHQSQPSLIVLFEHPEWQKPLFEALRRRNVPFEALDLKQAAFSGRQSPPRALFFNQASPSAYVRGNARAVPFALSYLRWLRSYGSEVINGAAAFEMELSKASQLHLFRTLNVDHPASWIFNDASALRKFAGEIPFPAVLKPDQGGSGARMMRVDSIEELERLLEERPGLWAPDGLLLLQECLPHEPEKDGIVRLEFLDGELLYAMRVRSRGGFNLCPSEICNPESEDEEATCNSDAPDRPEFLPFLEVPSEAVEMGKKIFQTAGLDIGAVEYLETLDGRRVFYDLNANSNLRASVGRAFGFDPFERVVDYLEARLRRFETLAMEIG